MSESQVPSLFIPQQQPNTLSSSQYRDKDYGDPVSFSFTDVQIVAVLPFHAPGKNLPATVRLAGLQLLSISTHRDQYPVTHLGHAGIEGYTRGHRTTAGTMGFTVLGEDPFAPIIAVYSEWRGYNQPSTWVGADDLPPFDLSIVFTNSAGNAAAVLLRSIVIVDTGRNISVRDIQLSHVCSFMASRVTTLLEGTTTINKLARFPHTGVDTGSAAAHDSGWNQTYTTPYTFTTSSGSTSTSTSTSTSNSSSTSTASTTTSSATTSSFSGTTSSTTLTATPTVSTGA